MIRPWQTLRECMKAGKGWSTGRAGSKIENRESRIGGRSSIFDPPCSIFIPLCALLLLVGCASNSGHLSRQLMAGKSMAQHNPDAGGSYLVGFPDVLEIQVNGHPEISRSCVIGPDGRIDLSVPASRTGSDRVRVEGKSPEE